MAIRTISGLWKSLNRVVSIRKTTVSVRVKAIYNVSFLRMHRWEVLVQLKVQFGGVLLRVTRCMALTVLFTSIIGNFERTVEPSRRNRPSRCGWVWLPMATRADRVSSLFRVPPMQQPLS